MNKAAARDAVDSVFATISEALANGDEVRIEGVGTFGARTRPTRTGRNPRNVAVRIMIRGLRILLQDKAGVRIAAT